MITRAPHQRTTPVRYTDPQYEAIRRQIELHPFPGEPSKYAGAFFLPDLVLKQSGIPNAGYGLFVSEDVFPGQVLTMYSKCIISEKEAKILKKQVCIMFSIVVYTYLLDKFLTTCCPRAIVISVPTTHRATAWIPNHQLQGDMTTMLAAMKLLVSPMLRMNCIQPTQNSWTLASTPSSLQNRGLEKTQRSLLPMIFE